MRMRQFIRAMVIPFFMAFFPSVWYINRNVATDGLSPYTEPTTESIGFAIAVAVFGSIMFAAVVAFFKVAGSEKEQNAWAYPQRVFQPDDTALIVFFAFITVSFVWALITMGGVGPALLGELLQIFLLPLAIPILILAPLTIQFHWAVIIGLMLCVLWMSLLGNIISDVIHKRPLPLSSG